MLLLLSTPPASAIICWSSWSLHMQWVCFLTLYTTTQLRFSFIVRIAFHNFTLWAYSHINGLLLPQLPATTTTACLGCRLWTHVWMYTLSMAPCRIHNRPYATNFRVPFSLHHFAWRNPRSTFHAIWLTLTCVCLNSGIIIFQKCINVFFITFSHIMKTPK